MIFFKINGKKGFSIPTAWRDVTFAQYVAILAVPYKIGEHIAIFTGIPHETLTKAKIRGLDRITLALEFMENTVKLEPSKMVGPYVLPDNLKIVSQAQLEDLQILTSRIPNKPTKDFTQEDHTTIMNLYLQATAIYIQPIKEGSYDFSRVPGLIEELKNYSCTEVIQIGSHLLLKPAYYINPN